MEAVLSYKDNGTYIGVYCGKELLGRIKTDKRGAFIYYPKGASARFKSAPFDRLNDLKQDLETL